MAMMYCETCGFEVVPCGHCRGTGWIYAVNWKRRIQLDYKVPCTSCEGTGKFCRHLARFTPEQLEKLQALKRDQ